MRLFNRLQSGLGAVGYPVAKRRVERRPLVAVKLLTLVMVHDVEQVDTPDIPIRVSFNEDGQPVCAVEACLSLVVSEIGSADEAPILEVIFEAPDDRANAAFLRRHSPHAEPKCIIKAPFDLHGNLPPETM